MSEKPSLTRQQRRARERAAEKALAKASASGDAEPALEAARRFRTDGEADRAGKLMIQLLEQQPELADAHIELAACLVALGRHDQALLPARRAIRYAPENARAHATMARTLAAGDRYVEAVQAADRAVELGGDDADVLIMASAVRYGIGDLDGALDFAMHALEVNPAAACIVNATAILTAQGRHEEARVLFDRARNAGLRDVSLDWNESATRLALGDFGVAWDLFEVGFENGQRIPNLPLPLPAWEGQDISGETVLVWREQGIGDEVRYLSCLPGLIQRCDKIVLWCSSRLVGLFSRSFPTAFVRALPPSLDAQPWLTDDAPAPDLHVPVGSLPRFLRRNLSDFPKQNVYLAADEERVEHFRRRLRELGERPKVGVAWRSGNLGTSRLRHYLTLDELLPILDLDVDLINLQYGEPKLLRSEVGQFASDHGLQIHVWDDIDYTNDLDEVAALTAALDAVVGPNSFPTNLAGALGVPTLMLQTTSASSGSQHLWWPCVIDLVRPYDAAWQPTVAEAAEALSAVLER